MNTENDVKKQPYEIDMFRPDDAEGVGRLFRTVYGEGYPVKLVYNPEALIEAFDRRENIPVVVRTEAGEIIAYEAIYRSSPNPEVYEAGQGLVLPQYRGSGLGTDVNRFVCDRMVPDLNLTYLFGEAVCNHIYMQKSWAGFGTVETAIEVDLMPAQAYAAEKSASGRVATLFMGRAYAGRRQAVYLPKRYEKGLRFIYSVLKEERDFRTGTGDLQPVRSEIVVQVFDSAQVARVTVKGAGADFADILAAKEKELAGKGVIVTQIWLNLSWPFIDAFVETLNRRGYFFGGLLPYWFGSDGLLMQKIDVRPNWEGINLYSEDAKAILEIVRGDWSRVTGKG